MHRIFTSIFTIVVPGGLILATLGYGLATSASLPLPCVLLVDDDQDNPDVRPYYSSALNEVGATYDVWDVAGQGDPAASDLMGYKMVIWFTGYPRSDTFTSANEVAVATYLDAGGRFWLVSGDYLYDRGLTSFGRSRLRIGSYTSDVNRTDPVGNAGHPIGSGLGPYNLTAPNGWPGDLYTDNVNHAGG
ncbi:MAG: hypothetical protein FJ014_13355 [Chloroflexi bacterium]|nr:hypothetical protein [Chloroflexota bacterium]